MRKEIEYLFKGTIQGNMDIEKMKFFELKSDARQKRWVVTLKENLDTLERLIMDDEAV